MGGGLSLGWHCGVTYQILGLYVNLFSHKEFFAKLIRVGGGLVWVGTMVSHTKFQVCISMRSLIRSFCKIDMGGGGRGGRSKFGLSLWCHIPNFRSVCQSVLS